MSTTNHDEYWKQVKADSVECVEELFDEGGAASPRTSWGTREA